MNLELGNKEVRTIVPNLMTGHEVIRSGVASEKQKKSVVRVNSVHVSHRHTGPDSTKPSRVQVS